MCLAPLFATIYLTLHLMFNFKEMRCASVEEFTKNNNTLVSQSIYQHFMV